MLTFICIYVFICVHVSICRYMNINVCMYITCVCMYTYVYIHIYIYIYKYCLDCQVMAQHCEEPAYIQTYVFIRIFTDIFICKYIHICTFTHKHTHTHAHTNTHTTTHTHTHAHTQTCTYIYLHKSAYSQNCKVTAQDWEHKKSAPAAGQIGVLSFSSRTFTTTREHVYIFTFNFIHICTHKNVFHTSCINMCICVFVEMCVRVYGWLRIDGCVLISMRAYLLQHVSMLSWNIFVFVYTYVYECVYICIWMDVYSFIHICALMYVYTYVHMYMDWRVLVYYGVASIRRLLKIVGLFCRISALL